jgi:hypothetical protein
MPSVKIDICEVARVSVWGPRRSFWLLDLDRVRWPIYVLPGGRLQRVRRKSIAVGAIYRVSMHPLVEFKERIAR